MTDQAFKDAKFNSLEIENSQLHLTLRSLSGTLKAQDQVIGELIKANVGLRGSLFLSEEDVSRMKREYEMLSEQCADLNRKLNENKLEEVA